MSEFDLVNLGEQRPTFAASHAKLAVASFHLSHLSEQPDDRMVDEIATMLRTGDNTIYANLKEGVEAEVVKHARGVAGLSQDVLTVRDDGTSYGGQTTAHDSLLLFTRLLHDAYELDKAYPKTRRRRFNAVSEALATNNTRYGVRARLDPHDGAVLLNKTGDLYGHDDPEVGESVHHDVGLVFTRGNGSKKRLVYSLTTSAQTKGESRRANRINQRLGAEFIAAVGGTPRTALGAKAVMLAGT